MASYALGSLLQVDGSGKAPSLSLTTPEAVVPKNQHGIPHSPTEFELDTLQWGVPLTGPSRKPSSENQTPSRTSDFNADIEPELHLTRTVTVRQSWTDPPINKWRLLSACIFQIANGMNDGVSGALIPYIERHYNIGYAVVSTIFITQAAGFILAAPLTKIIENRLGRSWAYTLAGACMMTGSLTIVPQPPFPLVVIAYAFIGFGEALNLALNNVFAANLANGTTVLGVVHGSYGVGATIAPLIATSEVSAGVRWSLFYIIPLVVLASAVAVAAWSYRGYKDESAAQLLEQTTTGASLVEKKALLKRALHNRTTILGALYIFLYQGAEVSISGWVISFLITYRHGNPFSVGYVTAGFWGGITVGRFVLSNPAQRLGERLSAFILVGGAAAFELLVWLVPNVIGDAVAVSLVGLLLGPLYPCAMVVFCRFLPKDIQMSSLSIISAFGSSGGAIFPFLTGLLSEKLGTVVLHPIAIIAFVGMEVAWACLPKVRKRRE